MQDSCNVSQSVLKSLQTGHDRTAHLAKVSCLDGASRTLGTGRAPGYLETEVLARGIRLTQQRRSVLRIIEATPQCRNVGVIHRRVRKEDPSVHRVTVYRTLALLNRHGLLGRSACEQLCAQPCCPQLPSSGWVQMKCVRCGKVVEFETGMLGEVNRCLEQDCRFRIASVKLELGGYCQECRS